MDLSLILRETKDNQIEKIPLKQIQENEKVNSNKEIFLIYNEINKNKNLYEKDKIIIKKIVNKENSMTQNKTKLIHNNKKELNTTLDFDKILYVLQKKKKKKKSYYLIRKQNKKHSNNRNINDIYNISNFCSNTYKIEEKSIPVNVKIPDYNELEDNYFIIDDFSNEVN